MKLTIPEPVRPKMKEYGLKEAPDGMLTWGWVKGELEKSKNYWICSTRPDGNPHAAPVWGILMDDVVYFSTGESSRKAKNIAHNPTIVLHLESGFDTVIIEGLVETVSDRADIERIAPIYATKYAPHGFEPTADDLAKGLMYRVVPRVVMAWKETDFPNTATRWEF